MEQSSLLEFFNKDEQSKEVIKRLITMFPTTEEITPQTVYRAGSSEARALINSVMGKVVLPTSKIINAQYLADLYRLSQEGHSCLLLVEHYGNFDLSNLCYLIANEPSLGDEFADRMIAIAGVKLSIENAFVAAFSQAYNRIVIYPSRGLDALTTDAEKDKMRKMIMPYNMSSMKELTFRKYNKQMVLVFPSGTRVRPWDDDTKKGVKEMASYAKTFEYLAFININGNNLPINKDDHDMTHDKPNPDLIWIEAHPLVKSIDFLAECTATLRPDTDSKTHTVKCIMDRLLGYHEALEPKRLDALANLGGR